VSVPAAFRGIALIGGRVDINANALVEAARKSGRLNSIAAGLSAAAAFLVGVSAVLGILVEK
jgi:hypothetical protein